MFFCARCDHHLVDHRAGGCSHVEELPSDDDDIVAIKLCCGCPGFKTEVTS